METLKFKGSTLQSAIDSIHRKWGPEAVILNVEKRKEAGSLFRSGRQWVEVTAQPPAQIQKKEDFPSPATQQSDVPVDVVEEELSALRNELKDFGASVRQIERINWARFQVQNKPAKPHSFVTYMIEKGIEPQEAEALYSEWTCQGGKLDVNACVLSIDQQIDRLDWDDVFPANEGRCTVLMGLPGTGKTLLLMKLAAQLYLRKKSKVVIVSADLTRPGPSQELSMYAEILQIPVRQIFELSELEKITKEVDARTHILVDWKGINPLESQSWQPLKLLKQYHLRPQIILTASLASDLRMWSEFRSQFSSLPIVGLALTQADLEHRVGKIWEAIRGTKLPLAFISTGKNVPGDLVEGKAFLLGPQLFRAYSLVWAQKEEKPSTTAILA